MYFKQKLWISLPWQFAVDQAFSSLQEKVPQTLMTRIKDHFQKLIKLMDSEVVECS